MGRVVTSRWPPGAVPVDPAVPVDRAAVVEQLRARLAAVPGSNTAPDRRDPDQRDPDRRGLAVATLRVAAAMDDRSQILPVADPLIPLLPEGGLRRGSVVAVLAGPPDLFLARGAGATSLLLALLARASAAGSWAAVVGVAGLGAVAAVEAGIDLARLALIPRPGPNLTGIAAALLDGVELVAFTGPERLSAAERSRLTARARQRGSVLIPLGAWPGADVVLRCSGARWVGSGPSGADPGAPGGPAGRRDRLRHRELLVSAGGRRTAAPVSTRLLLPADGGPVRSVAVRSVAGVTGEVVVRPRAVAG